MNPSTATALANTTKTTNPIITEICEGLTAPQKTISPKYFYDQLGSELFELITELPEYYPTRTEIDILQKNADSIAHLLGEDIYLIEPGAGSCSKVRHLLEAIRPQCYLPMDISEEFLFQSAQQLGNDFNWLTLKPIAADFTQELAIPSLPDSAKAVIFYPGSTIGNFEPDDAIDFLNNAKKLIGEDGGILIGIDLQKDHNLLNAAYNDACGITEKFNLNVLSHINNLMDCNFDPNKFHHRAFYNDLENRIEMHLVCNQAHQIVYEEMVIDFEEGETIHTESSYKYTLEGIGKLANAAGLSLIKSWTDDNKLFSVNYLSRQ